MDKKLFGGYLLSNNFFLEKQVLTEPVIEEIGIVL